MTVTIPGDALRRALERAGMTQVELARELHYTEAAVSRWARGAAPLKGDSADRVVAVLRSHGVDLAAAPTYRVFLATPMAALDAAGYERARAEAEAVHAELERVAGPVYWPASGIGSADLFEAPDLATGRNLVVLNECEAFVFLQTQAIGKRTSCDNEIGRAQALRKPVTVFAPSEDSLPYMLRGYEAVAPRLGERYRFYRSTDALRLLEIHGAELIGLDTAPVAA